MGTTDKPKKPRAVVPSGLWPGSSPELIAAHERALGLVSDEDFSAVDATRGLANSLFFVVVLCLACVGISFIFEDCPGVRLDEGSVERRKYEYFAANKDEFDTLVVGSSQVYRHVNPILFDEEVAENGHSTRSFNFGIGGMYMPEIFYAVDWILAQKPEKLKYMLVELRELEPVLFEQNKLSRREISWHTPEVTKFMETLAWRSDREVEEKFDLQLYTLRRALYRLGNVSLAIPAIEDWLDGRSKNPKPWLRRGHLPIDAELKQDPDDRILRRRRQWFLDNPRAHAKNMEAFYEDPPNQEPEQLMIDSLTEFVAKIRAAGVEPIFFIGVPSYRNYSDIVRLEEMGVLPVLFHYHDPETYPEFYDREKLFEMRHLLSPGAERFTKLLAADFAEYLTKTGEQ